MLWFLSRRAREHVAMIDRHLRPFLRREGFRLNTVRGSGYEWMALYASRRCRLAIYQSARNGEVNALIALPSASTNAGAIRREQGWHYIYGFTREGLSFDELLASVPEHPVGFEKQMADVAETLENHFSMMLARILSPDGGRA